MREKLTCDRPIELRPVKIPDFIDPQPMEPVRHIWLRANGQLPDDLRIHKYLLAYASDFSFVTTSLNPHSVNFWQPNMQVASIDHAMWFHQDFRMDEWLLYSMEAPLPVVQEVWPVDKFSTNKDNWLLQPCRKG